jgi:hypothetical protein
LDRLKKALKRFKAANAKQRSDLVTEEEKLEVIKDTDVYVGPDGKKLQVSLLFIFKLADVHIFDSISQ